MNNVGEERQREEGNEKRLFFFESRGVTKNKIRRATTLGVENNEGRRRGRRKRGARFGAREVRFVDGGEPAIYPIQSRGLDPV